MTADPAEWEQPGLGFGGDAAVPPLRPRAEVPVAYQGGKTRLAAAIVDVLAPGDGPLLDLCCGSGAVSVEAVNRGLDPRAVTMVDAGPWGAVWEAVGAGTLDVDHLAALCRAVPSDPALVRGFLAELAARPAADHTAETFLVLQAGAFGGKALWVDEAGRWANTTFRGWWQPPPTSDFADPDAPALFDDGETKRPLSEMTSRRTPVNPMMPMPDELLRRAERLCRRMAGVTGVRGDAAAARAPAGATVYVDPPYDGTTAYGPHTLDAVAVARRLAVGGATAWVSEGRPLSDGAVLLSSGRAKGGITGARRDANAEWLSPFRPPAA